jgi:hypothetical protein
MRRGLIHWSRTEVPAAALERRVARLQKAMAEEDVAAVLVYTSTAQPAAVSWLTHFVPYSNDGLLVVFRDGPPDFFASFSKRVAGWIREVSHVGEIHLGANLGRGAAKLLEQRFDATRPRIAIVDRDQLPFAVLEPVLEAGWREPQDFSAAFQRVRQPADAEEIRLAHRAADIARRALSAIPSVRKHASEVLAAVEASARNEGAEEVLLRIAPDLASAPAMTRLEGDAALGARAAVQVSLAYKGVWVRAARNLSAATEPSDWQVATNWLNEAAARLRPDDAPGRVVRWTMEACIGSRPLTPVQQLPRGSLAVVSAELELPDRTPWHGSALVVV